MMEASILARRLDRAIKAASSPSPVVGRSGVSTVAEIYAPRVKVWRGIVAEIGRGATFLSVVCGASSRVAALEEEIASGFRTKDATAEVAALKLVLSNARDIAR